MPPARDDRYRKSYDTYELLDGERLVEGWTTSGGFLWLTSHRLLHEPMRTPEDFLASAAKLFGLGDAGDALKAGVALADTRSKWAFPLNEIADVTPGPGRSQLSVTRRSGEVWSVEVSAGMYALRRGAASVAACDAAVHAIGAAVGTAPPETPPAPAAAQLPGVLAGPRAAPAVEPFEWPADLLPARAQAVTTGRDVVVDRDGDFLAYVSPAGRLHWRMGDYGSPLPAGATQPANLVGRWILTRDMASTWPGAPAHLDLAADGTLGGALQLFGALPPLPLEQAAWGWTQADATLTCDYRVPPVGEFLVIEARVPIRVGSVGPNRIGGRDDDEAFELVRAP